MAFLRTSRREAVHYYVILSLMCTVTFVYLHFTLDSSFTCWQWCSSPTLRLAFVSSAGKIVTTTVFWGEFGWLTLAIWKTCLKFPPPLSPPIFSQISSSGMLLCHVRRSRLSEREMTLWFYIPLILAILTVYYANQSVVSEQKNNLSWDKKHTLFEYLSSPFNCWNTLSWRDFTLTLGVVLMMVLSSSSLWSSGIHSALMLPWTMLCCSARREPSHSVFMPYCFSHL